MRFATAIPMKGASGRFASDKALQFMEEVGDKSSKVIIKTDQEPSIKHLVKDPVDSRTDGKTLVEMSPLKSSGSNGMVEKCIQEIEGQSRALLLAFESRIGREISAKEAIVIFMPEYGVYLLKRRDVRFDGKTAYERNKGKRATVRGLEFGEKLIYKVKAGDKDEKIHTLWEYGIFVGVRQHSGELCVSVKDKVMTVRSVRRIPVEERWSEDNVKWVTRAPCNHYKGCEFADGETPEVVEEASELKPVLGVAKTVFVETTERAPREFHIRKDDCDDHGYTKGCGGCNTWFRGLSRQPHSEACRERFAVLLQDNERFINAAERKKEFEKRQLEKQDLKRKAEGDGDQDDRFVTPADEGRVNPGGTSSGSAQKRKAEDLPAGEESRCEEVVII